MRKSIAFFALLTVVAVAVYSQTTESKTGRKFIAPVFFALEEAVNLAFEDN